MAHASRAGCNYHFLHIDAPPCTLSALRCLEPTQLRASPKWRLFASSRPSALGVYNYHAMAAYREMLTWHTPCKATLIGGSAGAGLRCQIQAFKLALALMCERIRLCVEIDDSRTAFCLQV